MGSQISPARDAPSPDESEIRTLYHQLLAAWNKRDADALAALFGGDGSVVGFDGSQMNGRPEIAGALCQIFANHPTAAYAKVREVRMLTPEVAILRAVAGMAAPGQSNLNPAVNAVQTLVATRHGGRWRVALFQNPPAQFHGRPDLARQLTDELQRLL